MEILGYFCAMIMGFVLGFIGGGGSILTVPILVYILGFDPIESTAYSLFIVGLAAAVGTFQYIRTRQIDFKVGAIFAIPSFLGVYSVRKFLVPSLPESLFSGSVLEIEKGAFILVFFSIVMIAAASSMIRKKSNKKKQYKTLNYPLIGLEGLIVGAVTGFVGAGGGFLIVPALVVLAGLEMKVAIGTSLLIIAVKSLFGFIGDVQVMENLDWQFLFQFSIFSILGILLGTKLSKKVSSQTLKPIFGWFVLAMGSWMLMKELFL